MMNIFKPKEKKTFEILLDEDSRYVHPGQEVKGHVILNFKGPEPIKTKGIKVRIYGLAKTEWTETETRKRDNGETYTVITHHGKEEILLDNHCYIFGDGKKQQPIVAPVNKVPHKFAFKFYLPLELSPTLKLKHGEISYEIQASLQRNWKSDRKAESKKIKVIDATNLAFIPEAKEPAEAQNFHYVKLWKMITLGKAHLQMKLPKSGYTFGSSIPIDIEHSNSSKSKTRKVELKFTEEITFKGHKKESKKVTSYWHVDVPDPSHIGSFTVKVPATFHPSRLPLCSLIETKHRLELKADLKGEPEPLKISVPIYLAAVEGPEVVYEEEVEEEKKSPGFARPMTSLKEGKLTPSAPSDEKDNEFKHRSDDINNEPFDPSAPPAYDMLH